MSERFIIPDGSLDTDVTLIDIETGKEYTDNFSDVVELLNELSEEARITNMTNKALIEFCKSRDHSLQEITTFVKDELIMI